MLLYSILWIYSTWLVKEKVIA